MTRAAAAAAAAAVAVLCAGAALWLGAHHPLAPAAVLAAAVLLAAVTAARPAALPLWLLALLPWIGLMPWTGWVTVEELDIAVLAVAAGGYMRLALRGALRRQPRPAADGGPPALPLRLAPVLCWLLPLLLSLLISLLRGVADAGGWSVGWWQGYREPLNSVRLAKPLVEVLLLLPLLRATSAGSRGGSADAQWLARRWLTALTLLLAGVALGVLWERLAFTGLLDFSTDYRATGLFWEMHVGGAGLDAALALSLPFAAAALLAARRPLAVTALAVVLTLGLYAALATFSRIVYAAVPLSLLCLLALRLAAAPAALSWRRVLPGLPWIAGFGLLATWVFANGGYRGLAAAAGATALALWAPARLRPLDAGGWILGIGLALPAAALVAALSLWLPKGAYLACAGTWCVGAGLVLLQQQPGAGSRVAYGALVLATLTAALTASVAVAVGWAGAQAWPSSLTVVALLALAVLAGSARRLPLWPDDLRWQAQLLAALLMTAAAVAVFNGGAYMGSRMATTGSDSQGRLQHWQRALDLLHGSDWAWGKGLGRYWDNQALSGLADDQTGDYRLLAPGPGRDSAAALLTSGRHDLGWSEALRLSQRVPAPAPGPARLVLDVRTDTGTKLQIEVCEKHLLYPSNCLALEHEVERRPGIWQRLQLLVPGAPPTPGAWYAPRIIVFTIGLGHQLNRVELDNLHLTDAAGRALLTNGDFAHGLAHWFFTSDRYHLPWHAKNLAVHLLFEQGWFGLAAFALAAAAALWRTALGAARRHPLAPALAAAIVGLLTVGLVDSILDMPRIAFITLLVLALALALPADQPRAVPARRPAPAP